ncbi:MAG: hypothetical protein Q9217_003596 [Psora testacea]
MAPSRASPKREASEQAPGHEEFVTSLTQFAAERGINVDFRTRVAGKVIDLQKLYDIVTARGGYDAVSAEKLAWRKIGVDFNLGSANAAAYAFALKTTYYKNLAAYEIKHMHGREPPPVEILEKLTAKGGDILNRTVETFQIPQKGPNLANGASDSEAEQASTPRGDKMDIDDPGSGGGRTTRGLRQQPPQRILFQPDITSSRQTRHSSGHLQSPQPPNPVSTYTGYSYSATSNPTSSAFSIANYEPRPQMPLTLRPIMTPSNNYPLFQAQIKKMRDAKLAALGLAPSTSVMKPGAGFEGPNIYVRILNCLRCPIPEEQDYALHHMVKISHERGDKYRFDSFPGLAEGLLEYLLNVSSLFYDVKWRVSYNQDDHNTEVLDGINGTPDIPQRIQSLRRIDSSDELQSQETTHKINKLLEAGLTLRNLAMLEDNALYLSEMTQLKDFLSIALNLPFAPSMTEMKHYALDIAEQVVRYWRMDESDPLYQSLLREVEDGHDRGAAVTALRTLCRISMNLEDSNLLPAVPVSVIRRLFEWIVLEDEEFVGACLDFLYQFTAIPKNVLLLFTNCNDLNLAALTSQLSRLLQYHALTAFNKTLVTKAVPITAATEVPSVPKELMDQFVRIDEPERSKIWLRSVFEEDPQSHVTQIALWQAYQQRFVEHAGQGTLLQAADFIKNVSSVFQGANAQVITGPSQKFIIKGIRPRHAPMDSRGRVYTRCLWKSPGAKACGEYFLKPRQIFEHIVSKHLGLERNEDGLWNFDSTLHGGKLPPDCFWATCHHFARRDGFVPTAYELGVHVKTHLPDISTKSAFRQKHNRTPATQTVPVKLLEGDSRVATTSYVDPEHGREATYKQLTYQNTAVDELGNAAGLPLTSALILRNLARNTPKAIALMKGVDHGVHDLFAVFDTTRCLDVCEQISEKHVLKLETVELDALRDQVQFDNERVRVQGVSDTERYMIIMVKRPLLAIAIRFRTVDRKIRKIQLNFKPGNGYDHALKFLQSFGLPIKDTVAPVRSAPLRPQSSQATCPSLAQPFMQQNWKRSQSTNENRPASQSLSSSAAYPSQSQQRMQQMSNDEQVHPDWVPSSAQPQLVVSRQPSISDRSDQGTLSQVIVPSPTSLMKETGWASEALAGKSLNPTTDVTYASQSNRTNFQNMTTCGCLQYAEDSAHPKKFGSQDWRSVSAPETQHNRANSESCCLSQMLPPQRKLPFPERKEKSATQDNETPVTASLDSVPSPKPARKVAATRERPLYAARAESAQPVISGKNPTSSPSAAEVTTSNIAQVKASGPKKGKSHVCSACGREYSRPGSLRRHMATHERPTSIATKAVEAPFSFINDVPSSRAPAEISNLKGPITLGLRVPTPSPLTLSNYAPAVVSDRTTSPQSQIEKSSRVCNKATQAALLNPLMSPLIQPNEVMASLDTWIRKYHHLTAPSQPLMTDKDQLANYAAQSDEERSKIIDNMICECLQDENFGKLAEDVERSWKRIGLGF